MCLKTTTNQFKIAENDIICYKYGQISDYIFDSPFQFYKYRPEETQPNVTINFTREDDSDKKNWLVFQGYHSFVKFSDARNAKDRYDNIGIFIIPKGTKYVDGEFVGKAMTSETIIYKCKATFINRWKLRLGLLKN